MVYYLRYSGIVFVAIVCLALFFLTGCTTQQTKTAPVAHEEEAKIPKTVSPEEKTMPVVASVQEEKKEEKGITEESLRCIICHEERGVTHGWVADWQGSMHARKRVGCEACHISDNSESLVKEAKAVNYLSPEGSTCEDKRVNRQVVAGICGKCHRKQYDEFEKSRHSISWQRVLECGPYATRPEDSGSNRCEQCHNIQFKCDSCHTRHTFSTLEAKTPDACRTCHMGSDHPQYEIFISSKHGAVYTASQSGILKESQSVKALRSPVCVTCHMPQGNHDISFGLAYGPAGGSVSYVDKKGVVADENELSKRRSEMLFVCAGCHSMNFAQKTLLTADDIHKQVDSYVKEAQDLIFELEKEELVFLPSGRLRDGLLPLHALLFGDTQAYDSKSKITDLFFQLTSSAAHAWKGAYHMNPNFTHLNGFVELRKDWGEIKEEARKLREEAEIKRKMNIKLR